MAEFMNTPVDATITDYVPYDRDDLIIQIENLKVENASNAQNSAYWFDRYNELRLKIDNAADAVRDYISENGEVAEELSEIAKYLDIPLTKEVTGTATFSITFTAQVPLDFYGEDLDLSFDVECGNYNVDEFDWNQDDLEVSMEDY